MSELRDRIAAALLAHSENPDSGPDCTCGWKWEGFGLWKDAYAGHLADAATRELGRSEATDEEELNALYERRAEEARQEWNDDE